ncbi:MAG: hypothetical protein F4Y39_17155 [Gemmatimonadetes bacterium]|nr:hypothetical protein [Gemmatimonadota bacterium]MYC15452.1 hypothetical protein [Gemmatimonadota bacterium]MYD60572.1 hypothetical protein [Gemmatimonadota bacterium]MYF73264.1 hypothetical protein [Gemmatimonadota bacterium]MYK52722.1 hypothetical protein [Gemmatimonadota bacterium]
MKRDHIIFIAFLFLFAAINIYLFGSDKLSLDWAGFGIFIAAGITLSLYSFLYEDNPLFKFAENLYVGVAAAYTLTQVWYNVLLVDVVNPLSELGSESMNNLWLIVPTLLGFFMLTQLSSAKFSWLSRIAFAFVVGLGSGLAIPRTIAANVLAQLEPTMQPITATWAGLDLFIILVGVVTVLVYFFYSVEHTGPVGVASKIGIWFLMISFGASFGYTIMARLSLLIGRVGFLLEDWLVLELPLF